MTDQQVAERVTCSMCLKELAHDQRYCPLFPDVEPPIFLGKRAEKWDRCVCLIHTCYDARALERSQR